MISVYLLLDSRIFVGVPPTLGGAAGRIPLPGFASDSPVLLPLWRSAGGAMLS